MTFVLSVHFDAFDQFVAWYLAYGRLMGGESDEVMIVFVILTFSLAIFSFRRWRELRHEITDRRWAEEAQRKSEERYRSLFEGARDAIYTTTREGEILDINSSMLDLFGYRREEMIGLNTLKTYVHPEGRSAFQEEIERKGFVRDYEIALRKKDGTEMECLITSNVRRSADGRTDGYQGIVRDMTEQKRMEKALRSQLHFLQQLLDALPLPVYYKDCQGVYLGCNEAFGEFIGLSKEQIVGKTVHGVFLQDLADIYDQADEALFRQTGTQVYEALFLHADRSRRNRRFQ